MIQNIADYINREITFNNNHHDINAHMCESLKSVSRLSVVPRTSLTSRLLFSSAQCRSVKVDHWLMGDESLEAGASYPCSCVYTHSSQDTQTSGRVRAMALHR